MDRYVPWADSLTEVYQDEPPADEATSMVKERWSRLLLFFRQTYNQEPDFVSRSPGRVNVIGEHIDYSLYDVLPMAISADVLVAIKIVANSDTPKVRLTNMNSEKFPSQEWKLGRNGEIEIDASTHEWTNYFKAGMRGASKYLQERKHKDISVASMDVVVDGNVPAGGGMSSSAALVCASALAVIIANGDPDVSKQDLFDLAVVSERAVGVFSGGMDQAASIFCRKDHLLACSFFPSFRTGHVPVPASSTGVIFLVAQSFVAADKHVTAPQQYNLRVVECTLAAVLLAKMHNVQLQHDSSPLGYSLRGFQAKVKDQGYIRPQAPDDELATMRSIIEDSLDQEDGYTRDELAELLEITVEKLEAEYMCQFPVLTDRFHLRNRALHVVNEARRVLSFNSILCQAQERQANLTEAELQSLGELMNRTQESCSEMYDCSTSELDEICAIARKSGSYGSRLTGAGWGGCTVHLIPTKCLEQVKKSLRDEYYLKKYPEMSQSLLEEAMVVSKPGPGSALIKSAALQAL